MLKYTKINRNGKDISIMELNRLRRRKSKSYQKLCVMLLFVFAIGIAGLFL